MEEDAIEDVIDDMVDAVEEVVEDVAEVVPILESELLMLLLFVSESSWYTE